MSLVKYRLNEAKIIVSPRFVVKKDRPDPERKIPDI